MTVALLCATAVPLSAQLQTPSAIENPPQKSVLIPVVKEAPAVSAPVTAVRSRFDVKLDEFASDGGDVAGLRDGKLVSMDLSGNVSTILDPACRLFGVARGIAIVGLACRDENVDRSAAVSLKTGKVQWTVPESWWPIATAKGLVILESSGDPTQLNAVDAVSGKTVWFSKPFGTLGCRIYAPGGQSDAVIAFLFNSGCGISANGGFVLLDLRNGSAIDDSEDVPGGPAFFGANERLILVDVGGGRSGEYGPARIFLYDAATFSRVAGFIAAPDPPHVYAGTFGNYSADAVALGNRAVYVGVGGSTYRYPLAVTRTPGRVDSGVGSWLGAAREDELFFADDATLWSVDVAADRATARSIAGAQGPYHSMVVKDDRGYVLTNDRRILTIDLEKRATISATQAPACYTLTSVETAGTAAAAVCGLGGGDSSGFVVIGLN